MGDESRKSVGLQTCNPCRLKPGHDERRSLVSAMARNISVLNRDLGADPCSIPLFIRDAGKQAGEMDSPFFPVLGLFQAAPAIAANRRYAVLI